MLTATVVLAAGRPYTELSRAGTACERIGGRIPVRRVVVLATRGMLMSKFLRTLACAGLIGAFLTVLAGAPALPAAAGNSMPGRAARLVDTSIVVGFLQYLVVANGTQARPGNQLAPGRGVAPTITSQPVSETVTAGATASFTAAASGSPTPTVQWRVSTNTGRSWSAIRGATSTTYSFTASLSQNGYEYEAVFTNSAGTATTKTANLTVTAALSSPPTITLQPTGETISAGTTASFSAAASGSPRPTVQWQVLTSAGTWTAIAGATSTTYSFTASLSQNGYEYEAVFTNSAGTATTNAATLTVTAAPLQSSNWSGYADSGATFNSVSANWTLPTVTCSSRTNAYSAQWVGIDGYTSSTVEQDGTETDCLGGVASYYAWYEMYGDSAVNSGYEVELSPSTNPVSPGDPMSASVSVAGDEWTLVITDLASNHGWTYSTPAITFSSAAQSSAEWIVERPEICSRTCSLTPLADFGSVSFSNALVTTTGPSGTISTNPDVAIEMVNGRTVIALPGTLDATGDSFTDTWKAAG